MQLWNELNDQQAQQVSGGEGIGPLVSTVIGFLREIDIQPGDFASNKIIPPGQVVSFVAQVVNDPDNAPPV